MANEISFNNEELKVLSDKFSKFGDGLSEKEKDVLSLILGRASGDTELKSSFTESKDTLINLANAIEGNKAAKDDVEWFFSWTYRF